MYQPELISTMAATLISSNRVSVPDAVQSAIKICDETTRQLEEAERKEKEAAEEAKRQEKEAKEEEKKSRK